MTKPRQPSKLDDHPRIPIGESEGWMREILAVMLEEVGRREAEYQREQAERHKNKSV